MKKFKKAILLGIVIAILGVFWLSSGITENLIKTSTSTQIQAYNHNPNNILENVFEKDGQTILPFIFENSDQTVTKVHIIEQFEKAGIQILNGEELGDTLVTGNIIKTNAKNYTVLIYGDVNKDGYVDTFDAERIVMHYVFEGGYTLTGISAIAANVNNNDNEIDTFDAERIVRFYVGFERKLVVNEPESQKQPEKPVGPVKPEYTVPTNLSAIYGDTLAKVALPKGFSFELPLETKVGDVGTNTFKVTYTPDDTEKYEIVKDILVTIEVKKAIPEYTAPAGLTVTKGKTLGEITLPEGFSFQDALTTKLEKIGANLVKVTYTPSDTKNYEIVKDIEISILVEEEIPVEKEDPEYEVPSGLKATYGDTLAKVTLPIGFTFQDASTTRVGIVGTHIFLVTYTPEDTTKYNVVRNIKVQITVGKATPSYKKPTNLKAYCGETLGDVTLPEGFTFQDPLTTSVGEVGTNKFKVTYTPDDVNNYEIVNNILVSIVVDKQRPEYTVPTGLSANYGDTLADVKGLMDDKFTFQDPLTTKLLTAGQVTYKMKYTPEDTDAYAVITDIPVTITVGKAAITVEKDEKDGYYIYANHKLTASIGENTKNVTSLTWEVTDENGEVVSKEDVATVTNITRKRI